MLLLNVMCDTSIPGAISASVLASHPFSCLFSIRKYSLGEGADAARLCGSAAMR